MMTTKSRKENTRVYIVTLSCMLVLMFVFLNSFYWPNEGVDKRKIVVAMIVFFSVIVIPVLSVTIHRVNEYIKNILHKIYDTAVIVKHKRRKILCVISIALVGIGLSHVITYLVSRFFMHNSYNSHLFYTMVALEGFTLGIGLMWKKASRKPEMVFFAIALIMGVYCISVTPGRVGVSWDDEIHYARTLEISNFLNGIMYEADLKNMEDYANNIYAHAGYDKTSDLAYTTELESLYAAKAWKEHNFSRYGVWSVAYIPSAIGIVLARGLNLSYMGVFNMGRIFNLLTYVTLICLSIKKVKYGKVLIAAIGLIPTTIFMASSYAYDSWVTGFTILGISYFWAELQENGTLTIKNTLIMIGAIALGCLPKAIYFPLLFPLLFMPKKKFVSSKQRKYYYAFIIGTGIFLVSTFILPMIIGGPGTGDARGGQDVNSAEQIKFILNNPLQYAKILLNFDMNYISIGNAGPMLQRFAYVGEGAFYGIVYLILAILTFIDRDANEKNYFVVKGTMVIACAVTIILSTTALYVSFTSVASETVAGMQGRYMIPTICPALLAIGIGGTSHKIDKNAFVCVPMLIIAITFIYNMFQFCVINY